MAYDAEMMEKRKGAMKPSGSLEVEMAFKKAAASKENDAENPAQDIQAAIELIKEIEISDEDRETLLALLGDEEVAEIVEEPIEETAPAMEAAV